MIDPFLLLLLINFLGAALLDKRRRCLFTKWARFLYRECWEEREEKKVPLAESAAAAIIGPIGIERDLAERGDRLSISLSLRRLMAAVQLMTNGRPISRRKNATNILIASHYDNLALFYRPCRLPLRGGLRCHHHDRHSFRDEPLRTCCLRTNTSLIPVLFGSTVRFYANDRSSLSR